MVWISLFLFFFLHNIGLVYFCHAGLWTLWLKCRCLLVDLDLDLGEVSANVVFYRVTCETSTRKNSAKDPVQFIMHLCYHDPFLFCFF